MIGQPPTIKHRLYFSLRKLLATTATIQVDGGQMRYYSYDNGSSLSNGIEKEKQVITDLLAETKPGDTFWDVGAQYGLYTCLIGQVLSDGTVFSFEPMPGPYLRMKQNAKLNRVSNTALRTALTSPEEAESEWLETGQGDVPFATGDEVAKKFGSNVDILKIDVEGGELLVLEGLKRTIHKDPPRVIYCEVHPEGIFDMEGYEDVGLSDEEREQLRGLLNNAGYSLRDIGKETGEPYLKATLEN